MEDTDLMPFGIHKGKEMADVPADYLLYIKSQYDAGTWEKTRFNKDVRKYIEENLEILEKETKQKLK